jgi:hypothetical protein
MRMVHERITFLPKRSARYPKTIPPRAVAASEAPISRDMDASLRPSVAWIGMVRKENNIRS